MSIILFLHSWNNYLWPLLINSKPAMMTAPVALGSLIGLTKVSWGGIMAGAVMLTAPMLVLFVRCSAISSPAFPPARSSDREAAWPESH